VTANRRSISAAERLLLRERPIFGGWGRAMVDERDDWAAIQLAILKNLGNVTLSSDLRDEVAEAERLLHGEGRLGEAVENADPDEPDVAGNFERKAEELRDLGGDTRSAEVSAYYNILGRFYDHLAEEVRKKSRR
jgi:hypothetical protein